VHLFRKWQIKSANQMLAVITDPPDHALDFFIIPEQRHDSRWLFFAMLALW